MRSPSFRGHPNETTRWRPPITRSLSRIRAWWFEHLDELTDARAIAKRFRAVEADDTGEDREPSTRLSEFDSNNISSIAFDIGNLFHGYDYTQVLYLVDCCFSLMRHLRQQVTIQELCHHRPDATLDNGFLLGSASQSKKLEPIDDR
jgi:hypothetical protein